MHMRWSVQFDSADVAEIRAHRSEQPGNSFIRIEPYTAYFVSVHGYGADMVTLSGHNREGIVEMRELLVNMLAALDTIDPAEGNQEDHFVRWEARPAVSPLTLSEVEAHLRDDHGDDLHDHDEVVLSGMRVLHDRLHQDHACGHRHASYQAEAVTG